MGLLLDWKKCLKWPTSPWFQPSKDHPHSTTSLNQFQIESIHSHQTHRLATCMVACGGMETTPIGTHHKYKIMGYALGINLSSGTSAKTYYSEQIQNLEDAYQTVYLLYVKKRLSHIRDSWIDEDFPQLKEIDDHIRSALGRDNPNFQNFLAQSGITQDMNKSASSLSPMDSMIEDAKKGCIKLIHDVDQVLKPKTMLTQEIAQKLGLRIDPELLSVLLDQDKGLPQLPAPSGMR